jgi:hypothetical protein
MKLRIAHRETRPRATPFAVRGWFMRIAGAYGVGSAPHPLY